MRSCICFHCVGPTGTGGSFSIKVNVCKCASVGYCMLVGDIFEGRWRHSATLLNDRWLVIIGGCTVNGSVLSDILLLDLCDWIIKKV